MPHLPLFPLGTVLCPGAPLPLRIFEPRYVAMLADLAGGRNERRLTFQRYVLATLLDDVLVSTVARAVSAARPKACPPSPSSSSTWLA